MLAAANYFEVLGTTPVMGRLLDGSDPHAAVISERFWGHALGAQPDVLGSALQVNGVVFHVTGITPAKFVGASPGEFGNEAERIKSVWLPLRALDAIAGRPGGVGCEHEDDGTPWDLE